jgi:hypothetical protein
VKQTPLPKAKAGGADRITIASGNFSRESAMLIDVREQARIIATDGDDDDTTPPHPIVERTLAKLRRQRHPTLAS